MGMTGLTRPARKCRGRMVMALLALAATVAFPPLARAQYWIPTNVTNPEVKLGVLDHDVHFLVGWENGLDINPELRLASPVSGLPVERQRVT